jgi:hypothetical protein
MNQIKVTCGFMLMITAYCGKYCVWSSGCVNVFLILHLATYCEGTSVKQNISLFSIVEFVVRNCEHCK